MTNKFSTVSIAVLASFLASGAYAADINGGLKDDPIFGEKVKTSRSGFYINGALGLSKTDRNVGGQISGEKYEADLVPESDPEAFTEGDLIVDHVLPFGKSEDVDATVFGAGASYLFHLPSSRFGIEIGVDGTVYSDNETAFAFVGNPIDFPNSENPGLSQDETTGSVKFKRDFDIDLVAKAHMFVTDRWSIYAGGGLSFARAGASGGHSNSNTSNDGEPIYVNSYDQNDTSFGYVLLAGTQVWLTDRITLGAEYSYKKHDFDFGSSSALYDAGAEGGDGAIRHSSDKIEVEDEVHAIKAKIGFKLN